VAVLISGANLFAHSPAQDHNRRRRGRAACFRCRQRYSSTGHHTNTRPKTDQRSRSTSASANDSGAARPEGKAGADNRRLPCVTKAHRETKNRMTRIVEAALSMAMPQTAQRLARRPIAASQICSPLIPHASMCNATASGKAYYAANAFRARAASISGPPVSHPPLLVPVPGTSATASKPISSASPGSAAQPKPGIVRNGQTGPLPEPRQYHEGQRNILALGQHFGQYRVRARSPHRAEADTAAPFTRVPIASPSPAGFGNMLFPASRKQPRCEAGPKRASWPQRHQRQRADEDSRSLHRRSRHSSTRMRASVCPTSVRTGAVGADTDRQQQQDRER